MHDQYNIERIDTSETTVVLRVEGKLDATTAPDMLAQCRAVRDQGRNLVVNLARVEFIASSGIGGLLALVEDFREVGVSIRFADLSSQVRLVIGLLNLESFLDIDDSESIALNRIAA